MAPSCITMMLMVSLEWTRVMRPQVVSPSRGTRTTRPVEGGMGEVVIGEFLELGWEGSGREELVVLLRVGEDTLAGKAGGVVGFDGELKRLIAHVLSGVVDGRFFFHDVLLEK